MTEKVDTAGVMTVLRAYGAQDKYFERGKCIFDGKKMMLRNEIYKTVYTRLSYEMKKNKTITLKELLNNLKDKYPTIIISQYHIYRIIKDNYFSLKLTRFRHEPILRFGKEINIKNK